MRAAAEVPKVAAAFAVADDLAELDQFGVWRYETVNGRQTKVPYSAVNGRKASSTNPRDWTTLERARDFLNRSQAFTGLAFVFLRGNGLAGIDLDDCLDEHGDVKVWARGIIERFADTYMEVSPSGTGIKIWTRGSLPSNVPGVKFGDGQIEMYDHARYFTITGRAFRGAPLQVEDHNEDLQRMYTHLNGARRGLALQPLEGGRIPYGRQHNTLVTLCGMLRRWRLCDEAIEACLQAANEYQCDKPGPRENISRIVKSTRTWAAR